jgi:hypothetical protein
MAKKRRVTPTPDEVKIVYVYPGYMGFRFTARGWDNSVIYDSSMGFKSRHSAREEARRLWPGVKVSFEVI